MQTRILPKEPLCLWFVRLKIPKGVTRNELTRKTQFIRRSMRDEYLEDLVDAGEIVIREFSDGRSHGETLILSEFASHE